jgi:hypothetical protein
MITTPRRGLQWRLDRTWRRNPRHRSGRWSTRRWGIERALEQAVQWRRSRRSAASRWVRVEPGLVDEYDATLAAALALAWEVPASWRRRPGAARYYIAAADLAAIGRALRRLSSLARALARAVVAAVGRPGRPRRLPPIGDAAALVRAVARRLASVGRTSRDAHAVV